jgi:hypothetical protein
MAIKGYIEQLQKMQLRGWAYDPDHPAEHLEIVVSRHGDVIARSTAGLTRSDLAAAGVGNGDHAFVVNFAHALSDEECAELQTIACTTTGEQLNLSRLIEKEAAATPVPGAPRPELRGSPLATQKPVFILGAARSGTSALAQALLKSEHFDGFGEGHLFELAARLVGASRSYYKDNGEETLATRDTLISRIPLRFIDEGIKDLFRSAARVAFRTAHWIDKTPTPGMILAAPLLLEVWPSAKFVFLKRRALENIDSRMRKFPTLDFAQHCEDWSRTMTAWIAVRDRLTHAAVEIEQLSMARSPAIVGQEISRFLQLAPDASRRFIEALSVDQPERTAADFAAIASLDRMGWSEQQVAIFAKICAEPMAAFGYTSDARYHLTA